MSPARAVSRIRVRYAETDKMGIVYYANYFIWFEVGRTDLLRSNGWSYREMEIEGYSLPVIETACAYRQPAKYDDDLEVRTIGTLLSPVRVRFDYEIVRCADEAALADGHTVHASLDANGRPKRFPTRVRELFEEGRPVLDTREHHRASSSTSGGGAPRATKK